MSQNQAVGHDHDDDTHIEVLRPGARLLRGQYEILSFLNNGGFGITYLARDSLERDVVIKECFPGALCRRNGDKVEAADPSYREDLHAIIDLFIQEARNHARLVHPNIVNVHQVFEDNQTAYIAMDLIKGGDLLEYMQDHKNNATPDFAVQVTEKMLSAVSFIHESGMLHRDISPDNILIDQNEQPVLIDFGAARERAANQNAALLALRVVKDGYSPHEFYVRGSEQGPSSDLYVLAATLYHAISGERPIDGQTRLNAFNNSQPDPYVPLASRFEGYPDGFLEAIDKAMEIHAADRVQTALEWLRMFRGPDVAFGNFTHRPVSMIVAVDRDEKEPLSEAEKERIRAETENAEAVVTALLAGNSDITIGGNPDGAKLPTELKPQEETQVAVDKVIRNDSGSGGKVLGLVALVTVAVAAGGYFALSGSKTELASPATSEGSPSIEAVAEPQDETVVGTQDIAQTDAASEAHDEASSQAFATSVGKGNESSAVTADASDPEASPEPENAETSIVAPVQDEVIEPNTPPAAAVDEAELAEASVSEEATADQLASEATATEAANADEIISARTPVVEPERAEETTQPETAASPPGSVSEQTNLLDNQVAFSHWDVEIPFETSIRRASNGNVIAVTGLDPSTDMTVIGDWVTQGTVIFTINGEQIPDGRSFASQVLDDLNVDSDGYIRVVARYRELGRTRANNGLLALPALRVLGLANGLGLVVRADGNEGWQTIVTAESAEAAPDLKVSDLIVREAITGEVIGDLESLDNALELLVADDQFEARLIVLRDGAEKEVVMQLARE